MALPRTLDAVKHGIRMGRHAGAQVYIQYQGEIVCHEAVGESANGVPMHGDTLKLWMSAGKPATAVAIMQQVERGRCQLDDAVAQYIPKFAVHGKAGITLRHLLTHTAGIRGADLVVKASSWDEASTAVCAVRPEPRWRPGEKAGYHVEGSWHLLGELVQRLDGRTIQRYLKEEIFDSLGMPDVWLGITPELVERYGDRIGLTYDSTSCPMQEAEAYTDLEGLAAIRPGANLRGPAEALGRFYEMLLDGGVWEGTRILCASSVDQMRERQRVKLFDHSFQHIMDWGLGFCINSSRYGLDTVPYGYGRFASEETFGHAGRQTGTAFADPAHALVVVVLLNGMPGEEVHQARMREICDAVYIDLGLADGA